MPRGKRRMFLGEGEGREGEATCVRYHTLPSNSPPLPYPPPQPTRPPPPPTQPGTSQKPAADGREAAVARYWEERGVLLRAARAVLRLAGGGAATAA